ncbi:MAG: hypothetical protein ACYS8W_01060 [Planctomycetota bacterium]|jgi:hypothetical protein
MAVPPLEEYYRKCLEIREGFAGRAWPKAYLDWHVVEALFAFTGEESIAEEDFPQIQERYKRGRDLLRAVYRHDEARDEFLDFLKSYPENTHSFQNQMSPLFVAAFNIISGRPICDRKVIEENKNLFRENLTIIDHPWYGEHAMTAQPLLDKYIVKVPWKERDPIRVLIVGSAEKPRGPSASVYLKQILARLPEGGHKVHITVNDVFFQQHVYSFNRAGFFRGKKSHFDFRKGSELFDKRRRIRLLKLDPSNPAEDLASSRFSPDDEYDIVISSRAAVQYAGSPAKLKTFQKNLRKYMSDGGVLFADDAELNHASVTLRRGSRFTVYPVCVPYWNRTSALMRCDTIVGAMGGLSSNEKQFLCDVFLHRCRYPLKDQPFIDLVLFAEYLANAGAPLHEVAATLLIGLPRQVVLSFPDSLLYRKTRRSLRAFEPPTIAARLRNMPTVMHLNLVRNTDLIELDATQKDIKALFSPKQTKLFDAGVYRIHLLESKKGNLLSVNHPDERGANFLLFGDIESIEYILSLPKSKLPNRTRNALIENINAGKLVLHYEDRIYPVFERIYPKVLKLGDNTTRDKFMYLLQAVKRALEQKHRRDDFTLGRGDPFNREKVDLGAP